MWDHLYRVHEGYRIGESYENTLCLRKDFWGNLVKGGALVTRLQTPRGLNPSWNGGASPWDIVMSLAEKEPVGSLQILRELDDSNQIVRLQDTEAGRYLEQDIQKLQDQYEKELNTLLKDLEETRNQGDAEMAKVFSDEADRYLLKLKKAESDLNQLRANLGRQPEPETLVFERRESLRFSTVAADNGKQGSDNAQLQKTNIGNRTETQMKNQTLNLTQNPKLGQNPNQIQDENKTQLKTQAQIDKGKSISRGLRHYFNNF
jgi:hypothetical protein